MTLDKILQELATLFFEDGRSGLYTGVNPNNPRVIPIERAKAEILKWAKENARIDVLRAKQVMNEKCQECTCPRGICYLTCSILANEIAKAKPVVIKEK